MVYDLIIIGAGPAGLTASLYASRYQIKHLLVGSRLGGAMVWAAMVENYPGFNSITGADLAQKMIEQVKKLGVEIKNTGVLEIKQKQKGFELKTENDEVYEAKTLIIATGTQRQKLNIPGEAEYLGKGVSYCATCDGAFFKDKIVAVVGGSNAAVTSALHLSDLAQKVYLIYRKKTLRADPIWRERAQKNSKVEIIYETNVMEILGNGNKVKALKLDRPYQSSSQLKVDGLFIEIGGKPGTELVKSLGVELDEKGYIKVKPDMSTNIAGVFAAGDVANASGEFQQIVTATSEGALAAKSVDQYLKGDNK
ncbi:thioredoxin-disulfide reductase [Patescibacteria group bacterium]|nr:thioredoxin-disulfide reductase [Patescibacteria group bacterium]